MKRILFIVPSLGMGGMERVLVNYANLFVARGYDVTVYNLTSGDSAITQHMSKQVQYYECYNPVKHLFHASFKDYLSRNIRFLPLNKWIRFHSAKYLHRKYVKDHFDIEVAFFGIAQMKIIGGCSEKNTLKIGWIHGLQLDSDIAPVGGLQQAIDVYNSMDRIICVSDLAREEVRDRFGRSKYVYTVNNPNDTKKIRDLANEGGVPQKEHFTFVTASRIEDRQKGFIRFFKVIKRLVDEGYEFTYWLVGDGIDYDKMKNFAEELKLNNVKFMGQQANPYKYIKNADMYVCTSFSEGFSMVMMETIILATPMLTTNVSGASEMLDSGKYGLIVENSEEGLYQGMKHILDDPELYHHYQKMAQERKDYLSEDRIMDQVEAIINQELH